VGYKHKVFETKRLHLRALSGKDSAFIHQLVNSQGWLAFIGDRGVRSVEDADRYIEKINGATDIYYWVAVLRQSDQAIGIVTFMKRKELDNFDIGFAFLPEYNGAGYAYEATWAVLAYLYYVRGHRQVLAVTKPSNSSSIKLLTRLGFKQIKEMDKEQYSSLLFSGSVKDLPLVN